MEDKRLLRIAKKQGFDNLEDYVRANIEHVPEFQRKMFYILFGKDKKTSTPECGPQDGKN